MKRLHRQSGLTLIELMIAVSLFTVVMMISTTMFLRSIDSQSRAISSKNLQESLNYALTFMSNEAVEAIPNPSSCYLIGFDCSTPTDFFCTTALNTVLRFRNSDAECVAYAIADDANGIPRVQVTRPGESGYITPENIRITGLNFAIGNVDDPTYPIGEVTMSITGETLTRENYSDSLRLQTTIAIWPE